MYKLDPSLSEITLLGHCSSSFGVRTTYTTRAKLPYLRARDCEGADGQAEVGDTSDPPMSPRCG
jgi:hypothetical protein